MLKKYFHKILFCLTTLGITSLQAAGLPEKQDEEKIIEYYNYTLKHSKKKINNSVDPDKLEEEKEELKDNHIGDRLNHKKGTVFFTVIVSNKKTKELLKFFFINRDPNTEKKAIRKSERVCSCHVISHTTPILSSHIIFQVLGWMEQNSRIYTPIFMHASSPLCITCDAIVRNLFNLNMPTNLTGCSGASDVELEKECPLLQQYIKSHLTLALAKKILLPQVKYTHQNQLREIEAKFELKLKRIKEKMKKHLVGNTLIGHTNGVCSVAITNDNRFTVSGSKDNTIRIWDFKTGKQLGYSPLKGHTSWVFSVAVTSDHKYIVSGSEDKTIRIWNFKTGKELGYSPLKGHTQEVRSVAVTKDNKYIVSGSDDSTIRIWDLKTGKEVGYSGLKGHTGFVSTVAVTDDSKYIVSGSDDGTIRIWDFKTGKEVSYSPLKGHTHWVRSVAVTKDNKYIVSGSYDRTIRIWDLKTGKEVNNSPLIGHTGIVHSVALTNENKYIVSGGGYQDKTIRIWGLKAGKELDYSPLKGHMGCVHSVAITKDNTYIISGSSDKSMRIWEFKLFNELIEEENIDSDKHNETDIDEYQEEHKASAYQEDNGVDNEVFDID